MASQKEASELEQLFNRLGVNETVIGSFTENGYSTIEELKCITDHDLKSLIPQVLLRKKFARSLALWLLDNDQEIEENILWTAGIHPRQTKAKTEGDPSSSSSSKSCASSIKSCDTITNTDRSEAQHNTDSADTASISDIIDISLFDRELEDLDLRVRIAEDVNNVKEYDPNTNSVTKVNSQTPIEVITRQKNPIWLLLNKSSLEGKRIASLSEESVLNAPEIKEVAQIVAQYLFADATPPKRQVPPSICMFWAKYFENLFPTTNAHRFYFMKNEIYHTKDGKQVNKGRPIGSLHTQLSLLRKKLLLNDDTAKLRASATPELKSTLQNNTPQKIKRASCHRSLAQASTSGYCPPESDKEIKSHLDNLRNNISTHVSAELTQEWTETHDYRMKELKETKGTLWDYLKSYKTLSAPNIGPSLIRTDFKLLFKESDPASKLQDFMISNRTKFIKLAKEVENKLTAPVQKDKISIFRSLAEGDDINEQTTGLLLLLPFLFPGVYQVNKNWKPTKSNVLDAFIFKADTEADVEDGIDKLRGHLQEVQTKLKWKNTIHLQPFVLAVGTSWSEIIQAHIIVDKVLYTFPSVLEAVESCFQLFHAFHAEYPLECHNVWEFIQQAVYGMYTPFDWNHRSTSELAELLHLSLQRPAHKNMRRVLN